MGYEWNDRLEAEYTRYVDGKWFKGLNARDRKGYLKARERWKRSRDVGTRFRDGMALLNGQTLERGYQKEVRIVTDRGARYHDVFSEKAQRGHEYKAGRVDKEKALPQLEKDERFMAAGGRVDWTIVQGARVDREVLDKLQEMKQKWGRQFNVQEVSREQRRTALTISKHLEKQKRAKEKEARARDREEQKRQRERAKEERDRERVQAAERAAAVQAAREFPTYEQLMQREPVQPVSKSTDRALSAPETERDRVAREAAESAIRNVQKQFGYNPLSLEKNTPERESAEAARARAEREAREATARTQAEAQRVQDAAFREMLNQARVPEAVRLGLLGQAHDPHAAVREPPGHAPNVERGGTGQTQGRDRGQSRDR
ncbi:hypothetical protein DFR70_103190 [Nocardia tenerifensis]|uniref:Uncharacterized protein n=1 Tax=Nocardia tenerifensis TaxID=228006 RepID=A0A318K881_9NOCA|nr:hypothetical protein [Nocardia tenerifensis]PXX66442.1 hypothetical protein DFR70_103190 [Nocardia tenerifensis]